MLHSKPFCVLLINPPFEGSYPSLPIGLAMLAAVLEQAGISVQVIDAWAERLNYAQLGQRIAAATPDLIGVTAMTPTFLQARRVVKEARKNAPDAMIVVGGPHPSAIPEETLRTVPEADVVCIGDGEGTILKLAEVLSGQGDISGITGIRGIAFRQNGKVIVNSGPKPLPNLETLPWPARHLFPLKKYQPHPPYGRKRPSMNVITTRGCPFGCVFCSKAVFGAKLRVRSPKNVVDEIEFLVREYGAREIHFYDDDFTINMKRAHQICEEILARNLHIEWACTTRVDLVAPDLLRLMKRAGCWLISYGVESGSQKILDQAGKGISLNDIRQAFGWTRESGIKAAAYFIVGLPGETEQTVEDTIELARELQPDFANWTQFFVFPGTPHYPPGYKPDKMTGFGGLSDSPYILPPTVGSEDGLSLQEMDRLFLRAIRAFYLRPSYFWRVMSGGSLSTSAFGDYVKTGIRVLLSLRNAGKRAVLP